MACVVAGARWQRGTICAHLPSGPLVGEFFAVSPDGGELWRTMGYFGNALVHENIVSKSCTAIAVGPLAAAISLMRSQP